MNFAIIFPGQGSQSIGMLYDLAQEKPTIKKSFDQASNVLGYDLWELVQAGPKEKLDQTQFTQPALLAADIAIFECWKELGGPLPTMMAGHSLGEYAALVAANALNFEDAIKLVANRGRYMQEAVAEGEGAMAAIIGLDEQQVESLCQEAAKGEIISPANYNSQGQIVIAGQANAVNRAIALAKDKGAKIAKLIPVSVPSHCALMKAAAERLAVDLAQVNIVKPEIAVIHNHDVSVHHSPQEIRDALVTQLVSPVRWVETIQFMFNRGINLWLECGPGKVLAGLNKRIVRAGNVLSINTLESITASMDVIK